MSEPLDLTVPPGQAVALGNALGRIETYYGTTLEQLAQVPLDVRLEIIEHCP